ncbi:MAG: S1C family serine protease [Nocardioides sp.]|uniref:S1C family serine protease n=1 Tax=Nocardioides sp. TaxID=35761 RepID=UPI003F0BD441
MSTPHGSDEEPTQPLGGWDAERAREAAAPEADAPDAAAPEGAAPEAAAPEVAEPDTSGPEPTRRLDVGPAQPGPAAAPAPAPAPGRQPGPYPGPSWGPGQPTGRPSPYATPAPGPYTPRPGAAPGAPLWTGAPAAPPAAKAPSLPLTVWVGVGVLALLLGALGGVLGAVAVRAGEDGNGGSSSDGLSSQPTRTAPPLTGDNSSVEAVADALLPSTVQILAGTDAGSGATGSGFVIDTSGHIVTNNHVVASVADGSGDLVVLTHDGGRLDAEIVGRSPVYDLALLQVDGGDQLEPASLGESSSVRVGQPVVAFGAPLGLSQTVTSGIVSALNRPVTTGDSANVSSYINAVQTDAAINPGNSGGPLVNLAGEVVGVNSAIATTGSGGESGNIGVGFAIPISQVRTTVDQILRTGEAQYPVIGAQVDVRGTDGLGAELTEVGRDSPAYAGGLRTGDVVTAVAEQRVGDGIAMIVAIRTHRPGDEVEFTFTRDDEERTATVRLNGEVG